MKVVLITGQFKTQADLNALLENLQNHLDVGYEIIAVTPHSQTGGVLYTLVLKPKGRPPGKKGKGDEGDDVNSD